MRRLYAYPFRAETKFPLAAESVVAAFPDLEHPQRSDYERLAAYFIEGFVSYASPTGALARYPGWRSESGSHSDAIEGFSRIAPLMAAWLSTSPTPQLVLPSSRTVDVADLLRRGVVNGTDPASPDYWGAIRDRDQRIVEAADVALALWLSRDMVWTGLPKAARERVVQWLIGVNHREVVDNNWHLFIATTNVVLKALGEQYEQTEIDRRVARIKHFYRGDGWFIDGDDGEVDYYNAWGFHYHLLWLNRIDPSLEPHFIDEASRRFNEDLVYLFGPNGFPPMGRSICYRLAATAPLILRAAQNSSGQARRALDLTWRFFLQHGAARRGRITQGYCGDDARILQSYSGPASCLWSLRSLVAALAIPSGQAFWSQPSTPLPVEVGDFNVHFPGARMRAIGTRATGNVRLMLDGASVTTVPRLRDYSMRARILELVDGRIRRPDNHEAEYRASTYDSNEPFCSCR